MKFAITNTACPLLSTPEFTAVFMHPLPVNSQGLLPAIEMVALPGTFLTILEQKSMHIFRVSLEGYPEGDLFVDMRFLQLVEKPQLASSKMLSYCVDELLEQLLRFKGLPYIWGGNWHQGIPQLLELYPPPCLLNCCDKKKWTLEGVDCSGLLYEVTEGYTPRNTSQLVSFGESVAIEGLSVVEIVKKVKPLDLIVWVGHVIIVLDEQTTIESSCSRGGVVTNRLETRLSEVLEERSRDFTVRRWI